MLCCLIWGKERGVEWLPCKNRSATRPRVALPPCSGDSGGGRNPSRLHPIPFTPLTAVRGAYRKSAQPPRKPGLGHKERCDDQRDGVAVGWQPPWPSGRRIRCPRGRICGGGGGMWRAAPAVVEWDTVAHRHPPGCSAAMPRQEAAWAWWGAAPATVARVQ